MTAISRPIRFGRPVRCSPPAGERACTAPLCSPTSVCSTRSSSPTSKTSTSASAPGSPVTVSATALTPWPTTTRGRRAARWPGSPPSSSSATCPLLLVKNVPARLLPSVVPRFVLVYSLMVLHQFRRGEGAAAVRGVARVGRARGPRPAAATGDPAVSPGRAPRTSATCSGRVCRQECECCADARPLAACPSGDDRVAP